MGEMMTVDYVLIGKNIRTIRKEKKLTQKELASRANITAAHLSHIESGQTKLSVQTLNDIAVALDASIDLILGRIEPIRNYSTGTDGVSEDLDERGKKLLQLYAEQLKLILNNE